MSDYKYPVSVDFSVLVGKILKSIERKDVSGDEELIIITEGGEKYRMYHSQDCCECVRIEDINGDLDDLIGSPITLAEESTNQPDEENPSPLEYGDSEELWTFYRLATQKGFVVIRWFGSSNGYYGVNVSFQQFFEEE